MFQTMQWMFMVWVIGTSACFVTKVPYVLDDLGDAPQQPEVSIDAVFDSDALLRDAARDGDVTTDRGDIGVDIPRDRALEVGVMLCGSAYVDTRNNNAHCGRCNRSCNDLAGRGGGVTAMQCENSACIVVGCAFPLVRNGARSACLPCGSPNTNACVTDAGLSCRVGGSPRLQLVEDWCEPCGGAGQGGCQTGLSCDDRLTSDSSTGFLCAPCGRSGQPACNDGVQCDTGGRVCATRYSDFGGCFYVYRCEDGEPYDGSIPMCADSPTPCEDSL